MNNIKMIKIIKDLLLKIVDEIDAGNTDISEEDSIEIINFINNILRKDNPMSKYQAYTYLNVSRATFDNMVRDGIIPEGIKVPGFKEKFWKRKDLDKVIKNKK